MPKGKDKKHEGVILLQHCYRWTKEQKTSPEEDKANFMSVLQLLATLSEALRLLENSNSCYLFLYVYPGRLGSLRQTQTPPASLLPPGSSAAAPGHAMCQSRSAGETLTPGKREELAASKLSDWAPWLCPLRKGGLRAGPGLRRSRSLQAFEVFGFQRSRKQISPAHEKVPGGTALCGACFSSNSTFSMLPSCMSPLPWDTYYFIICKNSSSPKGGCLFKSKS